MVLTIDLNNEKDLERAQSILDVFCSHKSMTFVQVQELFRYVREDKKIDAIRLIRQVYGFQLKEAKEAVEAMIFNYIRGVC